MLDVGNTRMVEYLLLIMNRYERGGKITINNIEI
jgi:hypothetical protein